MTGETRSLSDFLWVLAGPIVWAVHFFVVYGPEAIICTRLGSPAYAMRWIVSVATAAAIGTLFIFFLRKRNRRREKSRDTAAFLNDISIALAWISMAAVAGVAAGSLSLPACTAVAG